MTAFGGRAFAVLWVATFLFYLGFQMLLPVMPLQAASLGGGEAHVGFIVGIFAFAAMLLRPVAGDLADRIGRRPLVLLGTAIFALAPLGYAVVGSIGGLFLLRLFHGVGMGLAPTAATVIATDLAPPARRGAAMGLFGLAPAVGLAVGPYAGGELVRALSFGPTFLVAAAIEAVALALAWSVPETQPAAPGRPGSGQPARGAGAAGLVRLARRWFSPAAVYPAALLLALYLSYGGLISFLPLFTARRGLGNPGQFFTVIAVASVVVRGPAGRLSDRLGRPAVVAPALALAGCGLLVLGATTAPGAFLTAAALYGLGVGAVQPALLAMTADRVPPEERGRAMGTFYTAWELGISGGSILFGLGLAWLDFDVMWRIAGGVAWLGAAGALGGVRRWRG
jgi:MFS family permease